MPSRISRTNAIQTNVTGNNFITAGLVCHYDAWVKSSSTRWDDLTANGFHITGSNISASTLTNVPGIGLAYRITGSGSNIVLPNINSTNLFTTQEETIEMYIYPQSNNSVWLSETSHGINTGWHIAKIILFDGHFYAYKWNQQSNPPACLLGKAYLNKWNHVVWRQVNNSTTKYFNWSDPTQFNFGRVVAIMNKPTNVFLNNYMGTHSCTMSFTTTYNYNGVTGNCRLVTATGEEYYIWVVNNGTNTSTVTQTFPIYLSNYSFPIQVIAEVYYSGWFFRNSSGYVNITYNTRKMDGFLNGSQSTFTQTNNRATPWLNNGGVTSYIPCVAYDSSTYGTAADPSGYVSMIRIYNRALSDSEILQNYNIFKTRNYLTAQNANNEPPMLLYYGNAGGIVSDNSWGEWVATYGDDNVFANYNVSREIYFDFDFFFFGTNYGKGLNGGIWMHAYGALAFGSNTPTNDWQPANGKAIKIGWNNDRRAPYGWYTNDISISPGYSYAGFHLNVRNSSQYIYYPPYTTWFGNSSSGGYYWSDYPNWSYTVKLFKTNNYQYIDIRCIDSGSAQGSWQLCNGSSLTNINALVGGQSMVLVSDAVGNNWTVYNPYYINEGMGLSSDFVYRYNVFMRYDANMLSKYYTPGEVVTTWANCGNVDFIDMTATSFGSPTLNRTGRNFWVNFSTNNQYFTIPQFNTNWIIASGGFTIALSAYFYNPTAYTWSRIIDFGNGEASDNIIVAKYSNTQSMNITLHNGNTNYLSSVSPTNAADSTWHVVIISVACTSNSTSVTWYDNSTSGTTVTTVGTGITEKNLYKNYIGKSHWSADSSFIGGMQEIIMFKGALNASNSADVMNYLKNKWQL